MAVKAPHAVNVERALEAVRAGRLIIITDDEDRENEGDFMVAAEKTTPEVVNFMATYGRGLICLPLTRERLQQLQLPLMVQENTARFQTAFTVTIDAVEGITTGISAFDRAATIRAAIDPKTKPSDLAKPGHILPLQAKEGGVLARAGQTEASVDLARMAGLTPAGVSPAIRARSTDASVWPARASTPPSLAWRGRMCPGLARSDGLVLGSMAARMVAARSKAEMPVVIPSTASIVTVKAVWKRAVFSWTMSGSWSCWRRSRVRGRQMSPRP